MHSFVTRHLPAHSHLTIARREECDLSATHSKIAAMIQPQCRGKRPGDGRAAKECDEVAPPHVKLPPLEDKAYQRTALCVTAKLARQ
jgi:hypothetical protein